MIAPLVAPLVLLTSVLAAPAPAERALEQRQAVSSSVASVIASVTSAASSVAGGATSAASSVAGGATSAASSVASGASSAASSAAATTSVASSAASSASSSVAAVPSSASSAVTSLASSVSSAASSAARPSSSAARVPAPIPNGGVGVRPNDTAPVYGVMSDFDYQSFQLGLYQEWIELDLFNYGVRRFSAQEFADAGLNAEDVSLIQFMANQEVGHATLLTNIINNGNRTAAPQCQYRYNFNTVRDFVNFCQRLTRWGESGVYGFLAHLDSRPAANLLVQSIATEARQQMAFRQFSGAFPMPVYFETGISQAMQWSLLSRYIIGCPSGTPNISWPIFPALSVTNDANLLQDGYLAAITHNRTSLTQPGRNVTFQWEAAGTQASYLPLYNATVGGLVDPNAAPKFVAWVNQLNVTYSPLTVTGNNTGYATQPGGVVFNTTNDGIINGTSFVGLTDTDLYVTPYNLSLLNDHLYAWGLYQAN